MSKIPEKLINFRVYLDGADLLGVADGKLPSLEAMTESVKGAGIAGEVDSPVMGHYKPMTLQLKWRTANDAQVKLAVQKAHHLDLRGAIQEYDSGSGEYRPVPLKVVVKAVPKKNDIGKLDVGAKMDAETELEVHYIKATLDGKDVYEIDKYNFICMIDGKDALADVRTALGLQ